MTLERRVEKGSINGIAFITCRIVTLREGEGESSGTSFFLLAKCEETPLPVLVTNRHVVEGCDDAKVYITRVDQDGTILYGSIIELNIHELQNAVIYHSDPDIDLAIISMSKFLTNLDEAGHFQRIGWLTSDSILDPENDDHLDYIEDVYVYGYPDGLWDDVYNLPLVRRGITATPAFHRFKDEPKFLIDCAIFPGSSGSPVIICKKDIATGQNTLLLAGVNSAVFQSRLDGSFATKPLPDSYQASVDVLTPNSIGIVVMASELHEMLDAVATAFGVTYCRRR